MCHNKLKRKSIVTIFQISEIIIDYQLKILN